MSDRACRSPSVRAIGSAPGAGVRAGRRPPRGLGLDAGEDAAIILAPGWGTGNGHAAFTSSTGRVRASSYAIGEIIPIDEWRRSWLYSSIQADTAARAWALVVALMGSGSLPEG